MALPDHIKEHFFSIENPKRGNAWYGAYTMLFIHLFSSQRSYQVTPLWHFTPKEDASGGTCIIDFIIVYLVKRRGSPILYVEIKPPQDLEDKSSSIAADDQMKNRMSSMQEALTIPTLYGISAMGTTFSVYTCHLNGDNSITLILSPSKKTMSTMLPLPNGGPMTSCHLGGRGVLRRSPRLSVLWLVILNQNDRVPFEKINSVIYMIYISLNASELLVDCKSAIYGCLWRISCQASICRTSALADAREFSAVMGTMHKNHRSRV
jgi:hypothetical protein